MLHNWNVRKARKKSSDEIVVKIYQGAQGIEDIVIGGDIKGHVGNHQRIGYEKLHGPP